MPTQLEQYKSRQAARRRTERTEASRRVERGVTKVGQVVGMAAAPHTTMGLKLGPIPVSAILSVPAAIVDVALAPKHPVAVFFLGLFEGLGFAEIPAASARLRP